MIRLARSTVVPRLAGPPYWSIVCFAIRPGHRTPEVARRLIDGVVDYARSQGAPGLEAYPVDIPAAEVPAGAEVEEVEAAASYAGLASAYVAAGFRPASETRARAAGRPRILVRLDLEGAGG
jgi:GNAT superfamily N-acetyltransferase